MKETFYFSHDYNCRQDEKIKLLIRKQGMQGYGIFWSIVEDLYNNNNQLKCDYFGIAYDLRVDEADVSKVVEGYGLFEIANGYFGSLSAQARIDERLEKSNKARQSAEKRWNKIRPHNENDANAMRDDSSGNAIKERKEKKENERKEKERFLVLPFSDDIFIKMWSEWKDYKIKQHGFKYKSVQSEQAALSALAELSGGECGAAIEIIKQSFLHGWKGLFELKNNINGNGNAKTHQQRGSHITEEQLHKSFVKRFSGEQHG